VKVCLCGVGDSCPEEGCCNDTMVEVVQFLHKHISVEVSYHWFFYVLLTVCFGIIFVNNLLDAQFFFVYVYFYSLHVLGSRVPIIRRINCIGMISGICHSV
jgi:hypothetical protein